jgi:hypothetical protein
MWQRHKAMAAAKARPLYTIQPPTGTPKVVFTEEDIVQGRERGKVVVQMLLEQLRDKKDSEQK